MSEPLDRAVVLDLFRQVAEHLEAARTSFETVPSKIVFNITEPLLNTVNQIIAEWEKQRC